MSDRLHVGIDENGLGPRLGPLVVTAIAARATEAGARRVARRPRGRLASRLGDSKDLVAFGDSALGEAWARAIVLRAGGDASSPEALVRALTLDPLEALRAPCPGEHHAQCWSAADEALEADDALVQSVARDLDALERGGVAIVSARVAVVCTSRLNEAAARGLSRFDVDLHAMERLALAARGDSDGEIAVTCGKVGGYASYSSAFGPLSGRLHATVVEGRAKSEYAFPGLGTLAFVRDADAKHALVAMASLVGKWVRDLFMRRVVRYHRAETPDLPMASGYHDPVTARFVAASALARKRRALPDDCFERVRVVRDDAATSSARPTPTPSAPPKRKPRGQPTPPEQPTLPTPGASPASRRASA